MRIDVSGIETIDEDWKEIQQQLILAVSQATSNGSNTVDTMKDLLEAHIQHDVYDVYRPKAYTRRSENNFGSQYPPLKDIEANAFTFEKGAGVTIDYKPSGDHPNPEWAERDGDELVKFIETTPSRPFPRPFWQKYVDDVVDGIEVYSAFADEMASVGIEIENDGMLIEREADDGQY